MINRRNFIQHASMAALTLPNLTSELLSIPKHRKNIGIQLYSVRVEMNQDAKGTLAKVARMGYNQVESFRSPKGLYSGLSPKEMAQTCKDLGMTLRSGHVHIDKDWLKTIDQAAESGQEYLIVASMTTQGQTIDNYKEVSDAFNKAGEQCKARGLKFGYHNHQYEFDTVDGQVLYDILVTNTDPKLVHLELDLGWAIAAGKNPFDYFDTYPGRFPLWHLKDMNVAEKKSTEFGKGTLDISGLLKSYKKSGMKYFFIEQEEYGKSAYESLAFDIDYYKKIKW
ncbi:MAG: sugar phosphate isomerase/epimerase [Saprospiraceae bacterium]